MSRGDRAGVRLWGHGRGLPSERGGGRCPLAGVGGRVRVADAVVPSVQPDIETLLGTPAMEKLMANERTKLAALAGSLPESLMS